MNSFAFHSFFTAELYFVQARLFSVLFRFKTIRANKFFRLPLEGLRFFYFFIFLSFNPSRYFSFQIIIHLSSEFSILSHSVFETFSSILKPFFTDTVLFFLTKHTIFYFTFFQFRVTFVVTAFKMQPTYHSTLLLQIFIQYISGCFFFFHFKTTLTNTILHFPPNL